MLRLEVPVALPAIGPAQAQVESWLAAHDVPDAAAYRVRLVLEELLANLAMHGRFAGPPPPTRLELKLREGEVRIVIEDAAAPFDPRPVPAPAPASLDDDRVGGLGLALVRRMADCLAYDRTAHGWNRTVLSIGFAA